MCVCTLPLLKLNINFGNKYLIGDNEYICKLSSFTCTINFS